MEKMSQLLAMLVTMATVVLSQTTEEGSAPMTTVVIPTQRVITDYEITLEVGLRTTSSIEVSWKEEMPDWQEVENYIMRTSRIGSDSVIVSPTLNSSHTEYNVEDLVKDADWKICVETLIRDTRTDTFDKRSKCATAATIPYVRNDSLYVLAIVIAYILVLILIGYISWRCAVQRAEKVEEEEEDDSNEGEQLLGGKE